LEELVERLAGECSAQDLEHVGLVIDFADVWAIGEYLHIDSGRCRRDAKGHTIDLKGPAI
jgi:hypothetical protein